MDDRTPIPVEVGNGTGLHSRAPSGDHPIPIGRIHIPVTMWVGVSVAIVSATVSVVAMWSSASKHAEIPYKHLDSNAALTGGGVAYKADVSDSRQEFSKRMVDESKKTRRLIKGISFDCKKGRGDTFVCRVNLPEEEL